MLTSTALTKSLLVRNGFMQSTRCLVLWNNNHTTPSLFMPRIATALETLLFMFTLLPLLFVWEDHNRKSFHDVSPQF